MSLTRSSLAVLILTIASSALAAPGDQEIQAALQQRVEHLMLIGTFEIDGTPLLAGQLIAAIYAERDYQPAWSRNDAMRQLRGLVALAESEGLPGRDYPLASVEALHARLGQNTTTAIDIASFDLLATELLARVIYHLRFGKVDPADQDPSWNFDREFRPASDPAETLDRITREPDIAAAVSAMFPRGYLYRRAKESLAEYRALERVGGWPVVRSGPVLKPGTTGPRVGELRARLRSRDPAVATAAGADNDYDEGLAAAVRDFQRHHGLEADGVVGEQTITALNVSVEHRIDQLRLTLERARWVLDELDKRFIVVNIPGFYAGLIEDRDYIWLTKVQVGTTYRKTPIFKGEIEYLVLNPTWVVPPTILRRDILPKLAADPGYLDEKNMRVLDRDWNPVDASAIDWTTMSARGFPYILEQRPGPHNALGRVKFIFPNPHLVFLHDTPSQNLFERANRSFSSGCIRVEDPLELTRLLLNDPDQWSAEQIAASIETAATRTVHLKQPLPVLLLYWTADFHPETGRAYFHNDVYSRDATLLNALNGEISIKLAD